MLRNGFRRCAQLGCCVNVRRCPRVLVLALPCSRAVEVHLAMFSAVHTLNLLHTRDPTFSAGAGGNWGVVPCHTMLARAAVYSKIAVLYD